MGISDLSLTVRYYCTDRVLLSTSGENKTMKLIAKPIVSLHTVPYPFLVGTCILSIAIPSLCWFGWSIWLVALCVIAAWLLLIFYVMRSIYRKHGNLALIFILVVGQTGHF